MQRFYPVCLTSWCYLFYIHQSGYVVHVIDVILCHYNALTSSINSSQKVVPYLIAEEQTEVKSGFSSVHLRPKAHQAKSSNQDTSFGVQQTFRVAND